MRAICFLLLLLSATLTGCDLYERIEVEEINPPQIENNDIIIPDWDQKPTQQ